MHSPLSVDTSEAGVGDLDVQMSCSGQRINPSFTQVGDNCFRFTFTPDAAAPHVADVAFNFEKVPGTIQSEDVKKY